MKWLRWFEKGVRHGTAEWLADGPKENGGTIVLARSLWVCGLLFLCYLVVRNIEICVEAGRECRPSTSAPWAQARDVVRVFMGIFAGVYTALYVRFASQWRYVAGVYNQIKAAECRLQARPPVLDQDQPEVPAIYQWKAGFVEDAYSLHLINKVHFASSVWAWTEDEKVMQELKKSPLIEDLEGMLRGVGAAVYKSAVDKEVRRRMNLITTSPEPESSQQSDPPPQQSEAA